ncbi:hypothetical protein ACFV0R_20470 [Streptomyces sp. NPDC059578]|uniref:hypothetical protein n=1 Tax=unclassified Streptomyces TaxID=2593676 RepID=UPI0036684849
MTEPQERSARDEVTMTRIGQAVMLHHGGDREEARDRFLVLWAEIVENGNPLHRCTLAHYLADTQDDPEAELAWDLRALSAAEELADGRVPPHALAPAARAFYPTLHLNLAADYARLGRREAARSHLRLSSGALDALDRDAHGEAVRSAIVRLGRQLDGDPPTDPGPIRRAP